ncbi:unnamed protein product [Meganyctiphanes norvegica]|uniref:Uncharacterized protein n=1 Tax=Meganyctiphanes norvegica TaxID=48144 RepID=A0AAV2QIX8_MEGNR
MYLMKRLTRLTQLTFPCKKAMFPWMRTSRKVPRPKKILQKRKSRTKVKKVKNPSPLKELTILNYCSRGKRTNDSLSPAKRQKVQHDLPVTYDNPRPAKRQRVQLDLSVSTCLPEKRPQSPLEKPPSKNLNSFDKTILVDKPTLGEKHKWRRKHLKSFNLTTRLGKEYIMVSKDQLEYWNLSRNCEIRCTRHEGPSTKKKCNGKVLIKNKGSASAEYVVTTCKRCGYSSDDVAQPYRSKECVKDHIDEEFNDNSEDDSDTVKTSNYLKVRDLQLTYASLLRDMGYLGYTEFMGTLGIGEAAKCTFYRHCKAIYRLHKENWIKFQEKAINEIKGIYQRQGHSPDRNGLMSITVSVDGSYPSVVIHHYFAYLMYLSHILVLLLMLLLPGDALNVKTESC